MKLTFDPMTIEHLGFKMYSQLPNALAELVANSYDADASRVDVEVVNGEEPQVVVRDDGHGMDVYDLENKYLRIGRNRRHRDSRVMSESGLRHVAGKKGLGKLALFGIGERIEVSSKRAGVAEGTSVDLDWRIMLDSDGDYEPETATWGAQAHKHGTKVAIRALKRKSPIRPSDLARSLSKLFNYFDDDFKVFVSDGKSNVEVTRGMRYESLRVEARWNVPESLDVPDSTALSDRISGALIASEKPLSQELRGVTLYVNGRLANEPEFFGAGESSYAFSYLTGYLDVDYLDDLDEDVISTDRRSISWEHEETEALREHLRRLVLEAARLRRGSRQAAKRKKLDGDLGIDRDGWTSSIQEKGAAEAVGDVLDVLASPDSEMSDRDRADIVDGLQRIAPDHADFHWRHVHPSLQQACEKEYVAGDYFGAIQEASKRYVNDVRSFSTIKGSESSVLRGSFGGGEPKLDVTRSWTEVRLSSSTLENMRTSQLMLSEGIWKGFRNPLGHEEKGLLYGAKVFTYQDCLDALSMLSQLRRRLDQFDQSGDT